MTQTIHHSKSVAKLIKFSSYLSKILTTVAIASVCFCIAFGFQKGIDFAGGILIEFSSTNKQDEKNIDELLHSLSKKLNTTQISLQPTGTNEYTLKLSSNQENNENNIVNIKLAIADTFSGVEFIQIEDVGPQVSSETLVQSIMAICFAMMVILIYLIIRFNWKFATVGVLILIQDIVICLGFVALFKLEMNLTMVAAFLTIIGYCINDTVVLYDRVRLNLRKFGSTNIQEIIYKSVLEVLRRSIITSFVTMLSLFGIFLFSDVAIMNFAIVVISGIIIGTLGSIFVAPNWLIKIKLTREIQTVKNKDPMFYAS